jgi:hypothetical protein
MSLIRTLIEGLGTSRFVDGRLQTDVQARSHTPSKVTPMSPPDELALLEEKALDKGISAEELTNIRRIGDCPAQMQARIKHLHGWLAAH